MATNLKLYLDSRAVSRGQAAPMKLAVRRGGKTSFIALDIRLKPEQWHPETEVVYAVCIVNACEYNKILSNDYIVIIYF